MNITIRRQSVGAESASDDHAVSLVIDKRTRLSDVFHALIQRGYFPRSAGEHAVWVMRCCGGDLIAWHTGAHAFYDRFPFGEPCILGVNAWVSPDIRFECVSSPQERAKQLFMLFGGKKPQMGREGFLREYQACRVPPEAEQEWLALLPRSADEETL